METMREKESIIETAMSETTAVESIIESVMSEGLTALYVGDLDESVRVEELEQLFSKTGDVDSVKICFDQTTDRPLGYGYVNYTNPQHAAKALEVLNFTTLNGRHIRISYSDRDGSQRKSGLGNIFIKNLDKEIDSRSLRDMFSKFGTILSSKVETDSSGVSKGYGFVHYGNEEASRKAIESLNGKLICGRELFVGPFLSKQEREMSIDKTKYTNVFVKNLSGWTTEEHLRSIFGEFGPTNSIAVMRDETGNSKCFAFVNFEKPEDAVKSVEMLNGRTFDGKKWYVGRAQKKYEREQELKAYHQQLATEARERMIGLNNLYVKNIDEKIDDDKLKSLFSSFGTITSCKIMCDSKGISKGYGFVAFSTTQEASKAILEMNGKMVGNKPLYVAIAERKEARQQRLQFIYSSMRPTVMVPPVSPHVPIYTTSGLRRPIFYPPAPPVFIPPMSRFMYQQPHFRPPPLLPNMVFPMMQRGLHDPRRPPVRPFMYQPQPIIMENSHRLQSQDRKMDRAIPIETLTSTLANASPSERREILGEKLYPLVEKVEPEMAAKLTDMLLEMDQTEVLHLLESPHSLRAKVGEAMEVIKNAPHSDKP